MQSRMRGLAGWAAGLSGWRDVHCVSQGAPLTLRRPRAALRVLLKEPAGPEVTARDTFRYNAAYTSRLYRVKVNNLQMQ